MGENYKGQEVGVKMFRILFAVPWVGRKAKEFLCHHLRNSLAVIIGNLSLVGSSLIVNDKNWRQNEAARAAAEHIVKDLERIGC